MISNNDVLLTSIYVLTFLMNTYDYFALLSVLEKFKEVDIFIHRHRKGPVALIDHGIKFSLKKFSFVVLWAIHVWFC